jgi:hypothetical protein
MRGGYEHQDAGPALGNRGLSGPGRLLDTKDMPKTKTKDGFFEFEDISGAKVRVNANDVSTIRRED